MEKALDFELTVTDINAINKLLNEVANGCDNAERIMISDLMWKLTFLGQKIERQKKRAPSS